MKTKRTYIGLMKTIVRRYLICLNQMYYWDIRAEKADDNDTANLYYKMRNDNAKAASELYNLLISEDVEEDVIADMHEYAEQQAKDGDIIKAAAEDMWFLPW